MSVGKFRTVSLLMPSIKIDIRYVKYLVTLGVALEGQVSCQHLFRFDFGKLFDRCRDFV